MSSSTTYKDVERAIKTCTNFRNGTGRGVFNRNTDNSFEYVVYSGQQLLLIIKNGRVSYFNGLYSDSMTTRLQVIVKKYYDVERLRICRR